MASSTPVAYLDSSALVKLIAIEAETAALRQELRRWPDRASSLLATVEVTRVARCLGGQAPAVAAGVLAGLRLLAIEPIVPAAAQIGATTLRSLDAIHLATAASISRQVGALITYDQRMITEAAVRLPNLRGSHESLPALTAADRRVRPNKKENEGRARVSRANQPAGAA